MRVRAVPVTSTTEFSQNAKARLATASQVWQTLSAGQRLSWKQYADANPATNALGNQIILSGSQIHARSYIRASIAAQTPLVVPPIVSAPTGLLTLSLVADVGAGDVEITFTDTPLAAADRLWIKAAVTSSAGIVYVQNLLRQTALSAVAAISPLSIQTEVEARIGVLTVGQTLHVEVAVFSNTTMQLSQPLKATALVTTT